MPIRLFLSANSHEPDMIISGGFNIYPTEVEQALYRHPAVYEACVVGVPNATWGESVKAVVVLRDGHRASESEVIQHCKQCERLAVPPCLPGIGT